MVSEQELIIGELPVTTRLGIGSEKLRLFLTGHRLIVAHVGKRGVGALVGMSLLGKFALALEALLKGGGEASRRKRLAASSPDEILSADQDNFFVNYDDIVSVGVEETPANVKITLVTRESKYDLLALMPYDQVAKLFRDVLGDKVARGVGP